MSERHLEVTLKEGRPIAAYLYLPRIDSEKSVRTEEAGYGLLVDYAADGRPIGIEITAPAHITVITLNALLERLGFEKLRPEEAAPLQVA